MNSIEQLREAVLANLTAVRAGDPAAKQSTLEAMRAAARAVAPDDPETQIRELVEAQGWANDRLSEQARANATVHIRKKAGRNLGNSFYSHAHRTRFIDGYIDPQGQTLCGAPATQFDESWADTRYPKALARVECPQCAALRNA